jgi:PAS domain S-box-containing protein
MTRKKKRTTESQLQLDSVQFSVLIQRIKDCAIYMLNPEGLIVSWNSGAEAIKGYTSEEILGRHFSCFYTEVDREKGVPMQALRQAASQGKFEAEGWRVRKDGTRFWASVLIDPIYDETGKFIGFAKVTRDLTERRHAQERLERAREQMLEIQRMESIGQLTGGVAHDFNNLLTIIMGNLEVAQRLMSREKSSALRLRRALENAMQGARRGATLTQRLLAFSRRQPLDPRPLNLNKFIAGEVEFLQRSLGETIAVEAVGGAGLWPIEADAGQLETALLNLAVNARDAMPDGGKLTIETSNAFLDEDYCRLNPEAERGQYVLISVSDNGMGMTEEIAQRAFEPFFSTKSVGQGTGLGLSQVYGFVKQSGGHIKIYSEPGEGTTVRIYFPRLFGEVDREEKPEYPEPISGNGREVILLVEDDQDVHAYLMETLRDLRYRVVSAHDFSSALRQLSQSNRKFDLLLTDVVLPGMNGRDLARKAHEIRPDLKVLFMTGYSRNAVVHQGRLDPEVELIQKPITRDELARRIRFLLDGNQRKQRAVQRPEGGG